MKKLSLLFGIILLLSGFSIAQKQTDAMLFGDVKTSNGKDHIPYATIFVKGTTIGTTADGTGHYKLAHLPLGKVVVVAQAMGYKKQEKEIFMEQGKGAKLYFELEEDALFLEQTVITGTRTEHHLKDVPIRTEVINMRVIENKNACNIYQALEGTPGVRVESQCSSCDFTMVRMQGLGAEHTQILINGQPMYSGLAAVYGLKQMSTIDVAQIEVIKGAGSALYGSSAVAGAINIITKEPSYIPMTNIDVQLGSFKTNKYDISSSMRNEKGNIGLNIFAQRITEGAIDYTGPGSTSKEVRQKDGYSDRVASNLTNAGFGLFFDHVLKKNDKLILRGRSVLEKRDGGSLVDDEYLNPFTEGTENVFTDRYEAEMKYSYPINEKSGIDFSLTFVNHNRTATNDSYLADFLDVHNDNVPDVRDMRPYLAKENSYSSTLTYHNKIKNHSILVGIQSFMSNFDESGMYVVVDSDSPFFGSSYKSFGNKHAREVGAFIQDEWKVTDKLMIVPGVRFDNHQSGEEYTASEKVFATDNFPKTNFNRSSVNPRIALKYDFTEKLSLRANAGTGFRSPFGFSEDLHLCSGSPRVWKSSDLEPETSMSYNLSMDYYNTKFRVSTNLFRTDLKNKIGFTDADDDVSALGYDYQWRNIDDAFVQGVELSVVATLIKNLTLGVDVTYNQGEYNNVREDWEDTEYEAVSKYISRFPATTGNIRLEYRPKHWSFYVTGSYTGQMYIDYYNDDVDPLVGDLSKIKKTNPFMTFNARVSRDIKNFKIYAGVNNITDYIQDERFLDDPAFLYAPIYGRLIYGGVSIKIVH